MNSGSSYLPFLWAAFVGVFLFGCTLDPEVDTNDPMAPAKPKVETISRVSAKVTVTGASRQPEDVSYGAEIVRIGADGESMEKVTCEIGKLGPNETYTWQANDLRPSSIYNARAFITNGRNRKYSDVNTFLTPSTSKATLSDVSLNGDILTASILDDGGRKIEEVGFIAGASSDRIELLREGGEKATKEEGRSFSLPLNTFRGGKTYYIIAYALDEKEDKGHSLNPKEVWLPLPVEAVSLSPESLTLVEDESVTLEVKIEPEDATDRTVTWKTSDAAIATVEEGVVTGIKEGTATITASVGGKSATCTVKVTKKFIPVTSISLSPSSLSLAKGDVATLVATVLPEDASDKTVTWYTSNEARIIVDQTGKVQAVGGGDARVTAVAGEQSAHCDIVVTVPVTEVTLSQSECVLEEGKTITLSASVLPEDATDKTVSWMSSNIEVATVSDGTITAIKEGTATITATAAGGKSATCEVSVNKKVVPVTSVTLSATSLSLIKGETTVLTATVLPEDATDKTVTWISSYEAIITVDQSGKVEAVGGGTARVTALAGEQSAFCDVVVTVPVSEISLDQTSRTLEEGQTFTLSANVLPEDATDKTITWTSSNSDVATVSEGIVTAIIEGKASITASAQGKSATCQVTVQKKVIAVTSVTLNKTTLSLIKGQEETLAATVLPEDATDKTVTWSSSDATTASVDQSGKVTAVKSGNATITAKAGEKTVTCEVSVSNPVASVSLDLTSVSLEEGQTTTLTATISPNDADVQTVTWSTSSSSIATVENGTVTAVSEGTATITASAGGKSATCQVTVQKKVIVVTSVSLNKSTLNLNKGQSETLTATVLPEDATDKTVTWSSSDATIASVDQAGKVTAVKSGIATITAKAGEQSAKCKVNITTPVESVTLDHASLELAEGETATLVATVSPDDAEEKTVTWTTSNVSVATVSDEGIVTAVAEGIATITASAGGKSATCSITVNAASTPVTSVSFTETERELYIDEVFTITATVSPDDATDKTLSWESSDASIASVSQNGEVTPKGIGICTITAKATSGESATFTCTVISEAPVFSDAVFKDYIYANFDTNHDGFLSRSEVLLIKEIYLESRTDITSLSGLEYLENLCTLYCGYTHITELDVSKCKKLEFLSCTGVQISFLDVTSCTQLRALYCYSVPISSLDVTNCNQLQVLSIGETHVSFLDVSKCTQLTGMYCHYTKISSLDVSNCTQLIELRCDNSPLTSLNISNCMNLKSLSCHSTQISSLDVSNCAQLTDLSCGYSRLTSLDVSKCTQLSVLSCETSPLLTSLNISNCTNLTSVSCQNTQISFLDVSNCAQLTYLNCDGTQVSSLDVSNCTQLTYLGCDGTLISSLDVSNCTKLGVLECEGTQLSSLDVSKCIELSSLYCAGTQVSSLNLSHCSKLINLSCTGTLITSLDVSHCTSLSFLFCGGTQITSLDVSKCTLLSYLDCESTMLTVLDLRNNGNLDQLHCRSCSQLTDIWLISAPRVFEHDSEVVIHYGS